MIYIIRIIFYLIDAGGLTIHVLEGFFPFIIDQEKILGPKILDQIPALSIFSA